MRISVALRPFLSVDTNAARSIVSPQYVKTVIFGLLSRTQMQYATRNLAACRSRARKIPLRVRENGSFWRISRTRSSISRARTIMSSIFLSNRSTWRTTLNACLTCDFQMYSTWAPICWIDSLAIQYGARQFYITFSNQRAPTGSAVVGSFCACLTRYGKDIWWCSRWCQRMFLPQKCINFLLRV